MIEEIEIINVRQIEYAKLHAESGLNILLGPSGSGKTTILESLHLLTTGSSHKTKKHNQIIKHSTEEAICRGTIKQNNTNHFLGISRQSDRKFKGVLNGASINRMSELAGICPIKIVDLSSSLIFEQSPSVRRSLLDWFLFHVKQEQFPYQSYNKLLIQRNHALHRQMTYDVISAIDKNLTILGETIHTFRCNLITLLNEKLQSDGKFQNISIAYKAGYNHQNGLESELISSYELDKKNKSTSKGPHRADFIVSQNNKPVKDFLSRGQLSAIAFWLHSTLLQTMNTQVAGVLCIDDLFALTDPDILLDMIHQSNVKQAWITITNTQLPQLSIQPSAVFHVEQGNICRIN